MAWLFVGLWMLMEGLFKLGVPIPAKEVLQAICLVIAGLMFILSFHWGSLR